MSSAVYREAWLAFIRACRAAGTDPDWTRDLPLRLRRHGLLDVDAELDVPMFRGGSAHAQFWSLTWEQARDRVTAVGEPAHVIDQGQADLAEEQRWFHGPAMVTAWGRRPRQNRLSRTDAPDYGGHRFALCQRMARSAVLARRP